MRSMLPEVQYLQVLLDIVECVPCIHQIVRLLFAYFAGSKRAQCCDALRQSAHRLALGKLQQTIVEIHGGRVAEVDAPSRRCRRTPTAERGYDDAHHRIERSCAAFRHHAREGSAIGAFAALHCQPARQFAHDTIQHVWRKCWNHPLPSRNRIQADLNLVASVPGGLLRVDQEAGDAVRHGSIFIVAVAIDAGIERWRPVETRSSVDSDPVELLHLRARLQQALHGLAVHAQGLRLVHAGGEVHVARAIGLVDARAAQLRMRRKECFRQDLRLVRAPHTLQTNLAQHLAPLLQDTRHLGRIFRVHIRPKFFRRKNCKQAGVVYEPHRVRVCGIHLPGGQR